MDSHNNFDYILTMVDSLTRFSVFVPCTKSITGEETLKLVMKEWIAKYDKPTTLMSDNDVRFSQQQGFWQKVFRQIGINIRFSIPRHPSSNGLCERTNRAFIQNIRALSIDLKTMDWPKLTPIVQWLMNSQISPKTGYSPSELFLGRPSWKLTLPNDPESTPTLDTFLSDQILMQETASKRLLELRSKALQYLNKRRVDPTYNSVILYLYQRFDGHKGRQRNLTPHGSVLFWCWKSNTIV